MPHKWYDGPLVIEYLSHYSVPGKANAKVTDLGHLQSAGDNEELEVVQTIKTWPIDSKLNIARLLHLLHGVKLKLQTLVMLLSPQNATLAITGVD